MRENNSWLHPSQLYKPKAQGWRFYDLTPLYIVYDVFLLWPLLYTEKNLARNPPVCAA